jgi:hypothetical protein
MVFVFFRTTTTDDDRRRVIRSGEADGDVLSSKHGSACVCDRVDESEAFVARAIVSRRRARLTSVRTSGCRGRQLGQDLQNFIQFQ